MLFNYVTDLEILLGSNDSGLVTMHNDDDLIEFMY